MALPIGTTLQSDKYRLDQILSQGNAGLTYKCTHLYLNQPIVIKTLNSEPGQSPATTQAQVQQFIGTTQQLAKFQHPHIVRVRDLFLQAGVPYMVMDYIPGQTLKALSVEHPLSQDCAIDYIRQVGSALDRLHHAGKLHGNITPDHLICSTQTHTIVLVGFDMTLAHPSNATLDPREPQLSAYAAPEQSLPQHQWSSATDLYGLAATLYTLLTGQVPIAAAQREHTSLPDPRRLQPQISFGVEQAILKGMALESEDRPQSIEDWLHLLPQSNPELQTSLASLKQASISQTTDRQSEPSPRS